MPWTLADDTFAHTWVEILWDLGKKYLRMVSGISTALRKKPVLLTASVGRLTAHRLLVGMLGMVMPGSAARLHQHEGCWGCTVKLGCLPPQNPTFFTRVKKKRKRKKGKRKKKVKASNNVKLAISNTVKKLTEIQRHKKIRHKPRRNQSMETKNQKWQRWYNS